MGLLNFITGLFHGDKVEVEYITQRSNMNDTLIFTGEPDYTSVISNGSADGSGTPISPRIIQQMAQEDARLNAANPIAGQRPNRGRGVGVATHQPPPGAPINPPNPNGNYVQPANYGQFAGGYNVQTGVPNGVPQGNYMQTNVQGQPQGGINIPINGAPQQQNMTAQAPVGLLAEPFSELVITDTECHLFVDLPGIPKENIGIKLTQNNEVAVTFKRETHVSIMSAEAKTTQKKGSKKKKDATKWAAQVNIPEYLLGEHTVVYSIMKPVDENRISCSFDLGQLHVVLGFRTPLEGKSIVIG